MKAAGLPFTNARRSGLYFQRKSEYPEAELNSRQFRRAKILLSAILAILFLFEVDFVVWQARGALFAARVMREGSALIDFAHERGLESQRKTGESFDQYERRMAAENRQTALLYSKLYSANVRQLRNGLARRNAVNSELDEFYRKPQSVVAVHEIGQTLFDLGIRLRSERLAPAVKVWIRHLIVI